MRSRIYEPSQNLKKKTDVLSVVMNGQVLVLFSRTGRGSQAKAVRLRQSGRFLFGAFALGPGGFSRHFQSLCADNRHPLIFMIRFGGKVKVDA